MSHAAPPVVSPDTASPDTNFMAGPAVQPTQNSSAQLAKSSGKALKLPQSPIGCPVDSLLRLITGQWTLYLMWRLHHEGPKRFGQLKRDLGGISAKVLTERLRMLEDYDLVTRDVKPTRPPEVTYTLTDRARELLDIMSPLYQLACKWAEEDKQS